MEEILQSTKPDLAKHVKPWYLPTKNETRQIDLV